MALFAAVIVTSCSTLQPQPTTQTEPAMQRLYVVDIPRTENMIFKNVLPDTMKIIGTYNVRGEGRFLLVNAETFNLIKEKFEEYKRMYATSKNIPQDRFVGMDLSVSAIGKLSLVSQKMINELPTEQDKELARTLNGYNKYTLIGESPKPIVITRTAKGDFIPDFAFSFSGVTTSVAPRSGSTGDNPPMNAWDKLMKERQKNN